MTPVQSPEAAGGQSSRYERNLAGGLEGKYLHVAAELQPGSRVLDVGGSSGYFSEALTAKGHTVALLDHDPASVATARARGLDARACDLNSTAAFSAVAGRQFDAILFMDVLEHVIDPHTVLLQARALLAPGGRVIVTGPNVAYWAVRLKLLSGRWDYAETGIMDRTHLRWFTFQTWQDLLASAGYDVTKAVACEGMLPKEQWLRRLGFSAARLARLRTKELAARPGLWGIVFLFIARPRQDAPSDSPR